MNVIGYCRVSSSEQGKSGLGIAAQREAIEAKCKLEGWELVEVVEEVASGANLTKRPALQGILSRLASGEADGIVSAKLDRISRSLLDFAAVIELSRKHDFRVIILDLNIDTSTPSGEMLANVLASFAQYERRLIGQRTKDALAVKKATGIRLGAPVLIAPETASLIVELRSGGSSLWSICNELEQRGIATSRGGRWRPCTVQRVLDRT